MSTGTTYSAINTHRGEVEIGYEYEIINKYTYPTKINYIEINGKGIDLSEFEVEDLSLMLETFFNMSDCSELAQAYFDLAEQE